MIGNDPEPMDVLDKRLEKRLQKKIKVSYTTLSKIDVQPFEFGNCTTIDISRKGLSLLVDEPIDVPILIQVKLDVPPRFSELIVLGKTVYCSRIEEKDVYRVGIRFVGILPVDLQSVVDQMKAE